MRHALPLIACALALSIAPLARADAEQDAKDLFARARELRSRGDCASAAPLFRRAWEAFPTGLGSLRNLAECETAVAHYAAARRAWLELSRALLVERDPKYRGWEDDARRAVEGLAGKVAALTIDVRVSDSGGEGPAGATSPITVLLDGERVPLALLRTPLDRDTGRHVVRVEGARVEAAAERAVELAPGRAESVTLIVHVLPEGRSPPAAPALPDARTRAPTPQGSSGSTLAVLGWIAASAGALALGASAVSFGVRQDALSELQRRCPQFAAGQPCDPGLAPTVGRGQAAATASTALFVAGAIALGAGIVMVAIAPAFKVRASAASIAAEWRF